MILQERCGKVTGPHRKAPEIAGSGSSIPTGNLLDFFPVDSDQFPVLSSRNRSEIIGKNPKIFRLEYCFHVPVTSGAFLPEPARIFRPGNVQLHGLISFESYMESDIESDKRTIHVHGEVSGCFLNLYVECDDLDA